MAIGIAALAACGTSGSGGAGGQATSGEGGSSGAGGSAASGGSSGGATGGGAGAVGNGGAAGATGTGGTNGTGGANGTGGTAGSGGAAGAGGARDGGGTGGAAGTGGTRDAGGGTGGSNVDAGNPGNGVSVTQYHNSAARDGVYLDPRMTRAAAATLHFDTTFTRPTITGPIFAQPLYVAGSAGRPDLVIVATEQDHVLAYNAANGSMVWDRSLGTPVPRAQLPCGNFNPVGVTGTPVIDPATRTIYVDGMVMGTGIQHLVFALDADTGTVKTGWPVDLNATARFTLPNGGGNLAFTSSIQNQRGALALVGGRVLVPFGGHVGDCQMYHGWVVGITASDPTQVTGWATRGFGGGIWGPGGIASDGTSAYVATGNTMGQVSNPLSAPANYSDGESLFKLPPSLAFSGQNTDFFAPTDWANLDRTDADLGGTGPILVTVPGATPSNLVVGLCKDGRAFVVNRANMGAMSPPIAATPVSSSTIITAAATYTTAGGTFVVFRGNGVNCPSGTGGLTAFRVTAANPPAVQTAWCGGPGTNASPAVSVTNAQGGDAVVWIMSNNRLQGLNGDTGAVVYNGGADAIAGVQSFQTPIVVNGRVFLVGNQLYAYTIN